MLEIKIQEYMIDIIEKYNNTSYKHIKNNINDLLKQRNFKPLHEILIQILDVSKHTAQSYTNRGNNSKPSLINLLKICNYFNISIEELLKENNNPIKDERKTKGNTSQFSLIRTFSIEDKKEFLKCYEDIGSVDTSKKYNISQFTCTRYYNNIKEELQ